MRKKKSNKVLFIIYKESKQVFFKHFRCQVVKTSLRESIANYFRRVETVANQMKRNEEALDEVRVIKKILLTLTPKFEYVVTAIEESKELFPISIEELMS